MVIKVGNQLMKEFPSELEEFFDKNPDVCQNNLDITTTPHLALAREGVLFITQRRQATSDLRENNKVKLLGSAAHMTCHAVFMRHTVSRVCSLGHFDNFSCWQFGDDSSHKEGLKTMIDEIIALSKDEYELGHINVSVFGGYTDPRGDARRNSMGLLRALYDEPRLLEVEHFCVGPYNTCIGEDGKNKAILIGVALDLRTQALFPASFEWNNYADFETQLRDRFLKRTGQGALLGGGDDMFKDMVKDATFKPKALRNPNTYKKLQALKENQEIENIKKQSMDIFGSAKKLNPSVQMKHYNEEKKRSQPQGELKKTKGLKGSV